MGINSVFNQSVRVFLWSLYVLSVLWLSIATSWWGLARLDYGYAVWYETLSIGAHITEYGALNKVSPGFDLLPQEHHHEAFRQIRQAVHGDPALLTGISYLGPDGAARPLLTQDEVLHLADVSALFSLGLWVSGVVLLCWLLSAVAVLRLGKPAMPVRLGIACCPFFAVGLWLLIAGPVGVFYVLHEWVFPPENTWFFYWEESLMSTLMKAPSLFGGIAVSIFIMAMVLVPAFYWGGARLAAGILPGTSSNGT